MNRLEIIAGLAKVRQDKKTDDDTYDRAVELAEMIGGFPDERDDHPVLQSLLAEAEDMVSQHHAHNFSGPIFDTVLVKDRATGEMVTDYQHKKTHKDARGRSIKEAFDHDGQAHRVAVLSREETLAEEKATEAAGAPTTVEAVYRARQTATAEVQAVLDLFAEGKFDEGIKAKSELSDARSYELWTQLPRETREYLKALGPPLPHEGNMVDKGNAPRGATDSSMTTD